jgi:hypothetical protein
MPAALLLALVLTLFPGRALAIHHLMTVAEVLLSFDGDGTVQYIELQDPIGEPFPDEDYDLDLYDTNAQPIGTVPLVVAPNTTRYWVATPAAELEFGETADAELTLALPAIGQACFAQVSGTRIHCLAWGCVATKVTGAAQGASPPDGSSLQKQGGNAYHVAVPTPNAANTAGTLEEPCPEPGQVLLTSIAAAALWARSRWAARGRGRARTGTVLSC